MSHPQGWAIAHNLSEGEALQYWFLCDGSELLMAQVCSQRDQGRSHAQALEWLIEQGGWQPQPPTV